MKLVPLMVLLSTPYWHYNARPQYHSPNTLSVSTFYCNMLLFLSNYSLIVNTTLCRVAVAITTEMVNARPVSDGVSQLSIDTVMMTRVLEGVIILYFLMLLGLLGQMVTTK